MMHREGEREVSFNQLGPTRFGSGTQNFHVVLMAQVRVLTIGNSLPFRQKTQKNGSFVTTKLRVNASKPLLPNVANPHALSSIDSPSVMPVSRNTLATNISKISPEQRVHIEDKGGKQARASARKSKRGERLTALVPVRMYRRENGSEGPTNHKGRGNEVN